IKTGNGLEIVAGSVYTNSCGIVPQSSGSNAAFCAEKAAGGSGSILFGPGVPPTAAVLTNVSLAACTTSGGGQVLAMGDVGTSYQPPPSFTPPPGTPGACVPSNCSPATASSPCTNGEPSQQCYSPGSYSTIGLGSGNQGPIANNLNPGVYYITGDMALNGCINNGGVDCGAIYFGGNTMNASFQYDRDQCWAAPNVPSSGTWTGSCPDGFTMD